MVGTGVDAVGPLPAEIAPPTTLVGFVSAHAKDPAGAKALLAYLSAPDAAAVYRANGRSRAASPQRASPISAISREGSITNRR